MSAPRGAPGRPANDYEQLAFHQPHDGAPWLNAWYPPYVAPEGRPHGSQAICVADDGLVLISLNGDTWGLPGGRPEGNETWEETLVREVREECCAEVSSSRLLGFTRGEALAGAEAGLILVRAVWRADVTLGEWKPEFETTHRRTVLPGDLAAVLTMEPGLERLYLRAFAEAGFSLA